MPNPSHSSTCHLCYCGNIELNTDAKSDFVNFNILCFFPREVLRERIHSGIIETFQIYITMFPLHPTHKMYELF